MTERSSTRSILLVIHLVLSGAGLSCYYILGQEFAGHAILMISLIALMLDAVICLRRQYPHIVLAPFFLAISTVSFVWLVVHQMIYRDTTIMTWYGTEYDYLDLTAIIYAAGLITVFSVWVPAIGFRRIFKNRIRKRINVAPSRRNIQIYNAIYLGIGTTYLLSNTGFEAPIVSYFGRVGFTATMFFIFWIGYWHKQGGTLFYLNALLILIIAAYIILSGGRFAAFMSLLLLAAGVTMSLKRKYRKRIMFVSIVLFPVGLWIVGILGNIRDVIGRGDLEVVSANRVDMFIWAVQNYDRVKKEAGKNNLAIRNAIERNINWVNLAVIAKTPKEQEYRRLSGIIEEYSSIFSLALLEGGGSKEAIRKSRVKKIDKGLRTGMANAYGFNVNEHTSVNWSVLSDMYSRGGLLYYGVGMIMLWALLWFIEVVIRSSRLARTDVVFLIAILLGIALRIESMPIYELMRMTGLYACIFGLSVVLARVTLSSFLNNPAELTRCVIQRQ